MYNCPYEKVLRSTQNRNVKNKRSSKTKIHMENSLQEEGKYWLKCHKEEIMINKILLYT